MFGKHVEELKAAKISGLNDIYVNKVTRRRLNPLISVLEHLYGNSLLYLSLSRNPMKTKTKYVSLHKLEPDR